MSAAAPAVDELSRDRHFAARGFFGRLLHPVVGEKPHPRPVFSIRGADVRTHTSAPLFDGATDEVLRSILRTSEWEIAYLHARGVIGGTPGGSPTPP
jgi:crotonobetainyl-CoA:carnitine CoA-transferase CaiB-like acyl-CoA transferase